MPIEEVTITELARRMERFGGVFPDDRAAYVAVNEIAEEVGAATLLAAGPITATASDRVQFFIHAAIVVFAQARCMAQVLGVSAEDLERSVAALIAAGESLGESLGSDLVERAEKQARPDSGDPRGN